jgi:hypothetical protein
MERIRGKDYFDVEDLANMWGCSVEYLQRRMNNSRFIYQEGDPKRVPDFNRQGGLTGQKPLWLKSRLGELNRWRNTYGIKGHNGGRRATRD